MTKPTGENLLGAIRFRFYLAGKLLRTETVEVVSGQHLSDLGLEHSMWMVRQAVATDSKWLVEAEILNDPTDPNRFLRFGTDEGGMVEPLPYREA